LAWKFDKFDEQTLINEPPIRAVPYSPCGATVIGLYVTMTVVGATALGSSLPPTDHHNHIRPVKIRVDNWDTIVCSGANSSNMKTLGTLAGELSGVLRLCESNTQRPALSISWRGSNISEVGQF
jgi:hypothetical protein